MAITEDRVREERDRGTTGEPVSRRRWGRWVALTVVVGAGVAVLWYALAGTSSGDTATTVAAAPNFTEVVTTDLVEVSEYDGTIGRLESDPVSVRVSGTVTAVPDEGSVLKQGDVLIWVNNEPVVLLYGDLPVWRTMSNGTAGPDVMQLETALSALGYDEGGYMSIDEDFTSYTASIVEDWQADIGASDDGVVNLGEVVFSSGELRVDSLQVSVGDVITEGTPIFTTSSDDVEVRFNLPTTQEDSLAVGDQVDITLPDLSKTTGMVTDIATVASVPDGGGQATFEVVVALDDASVANGIEEAPVTVEVVTDRVDNVLAVPVQSLLALEEGGYAVEVQDPAGTHLVAVEPGFYADGLIEVTGDISAGDMVVVP